MDNLIWKAQPTAKSSLITWAIVLSPLVLLLVLLSMAVHVGAGLGHMPRNGADTYHTPAYAVHEYVLQGVAYFVLFAAIPLWLLLLCSRRFRISLKFHLAQFGAYVAAWLLVVLYMMVDPGGFVAWFLDF